MKHTQGPWKAKEQFRDCTSNDTGHFILWQDTSKSGVVWRRLDDKYGKGGSFKEADAKLIAAAPKLLEALEMMLSADGAICENVGSKADQAMARIAAIDQARAAIAKATNE